MKQTENIPETLSQDTSSEISTNQYYEAHYYYKSYKVLTTASHWCDPSTGEMVKLSHNLKAVYSHKINQYLSFTKKKQVYRESHQRVSDLLGVGIKVVESAISLLKRMNLCHIEKISHKNYVTTMYHLEHVKGGFESLINPKLENHLSKQVKKKKQYKEAITYKQLKTIKKNKAKIEKMKNNMKEEYFILTLDEMERLRGSSGSKSNASEDKTG